MLNNVPELENACESSIIDVRNILANNRYLCGELKLGYFIPSAQEFIKQFYVFSEDGYTGCVDKYAEKVLGTEEYNSKKYKDEAYLFVPFNEEYYLGLSSYIDDAWNKYKSNLKK